MCNANMEIEDGREFAFCTYCGTKVHIHSNAENVYSLASKINKFLEIYQQNPQESISNMVDTIVQQMLKQYPTHYLSYLCEAKWLSDNFTDIKGHRCGNFMTITDKIFQSIAFASNTELLEIRKEVLPYIRKLQDYISNLEDRKKIIEENLREKNALLVKNIHKFPQLIDGLFLSQPIDRGYSKTARIQSKDGSHYTNFRHNNQLQYEYAKSCLVASVYVESKPLLSSDYRYREVNIPVFFDRENTLMNINGKSKFLLDNKAIKLISLERIFFAGIESDKTIYKWTFLHGNEVKTVECWISFSTEQGLSKLGFKEFDLSDEEKSQLKYDLVDLRKVVENLEKHMIIES